MEVSELESFIYEILSAPDVDLASISAKRVRKQLAEDERVGADFIRINKEAVDELISEVFERVSAETGFQQSTEDDQAQEEEDASAKRSRDTTEDDAEARPPKKKRSKGKGADAQAMSDAALARKLSEEINGRQRSSRSGITPSGRGRGGKANGTKRRKAKSAETVDESGNEGADSDDAPKKKKRGGGGGGFAKPYQLSDALVEIVKEEQLARPQVVKKLWDYIKENDLQNPTNRREILCDSKLRAMFNMDKVNMFTMNKELSKHLFEPGTTA